MNDFQIDYVEWPADPDSLDLTSGSNDLKRLANMLVDVETVTDEFLRMKTSTDETLRALVAYATADAEMAQRLHEQYKWFWWATPRRVTPKVSMIPNRSNGRGIVGMWLDEWAQWEFDVFGDTVEVNGIRMPRKIPTKKEIELPHFDIREQRGEKEKIRKGVIRSFNQPVAKKRRRRDGGVSPWETKRRQIRSRSNLKT